MAKKHYSTHGNVAYAPEHEENAPRKTRQPQKAPQARPSVKPLTRKRVQVREADSLSYDAVFGFIATGVLATLVMMGYAELATSSDEVVQLRSQLNQLQSEQKVLSAQYEKHFDIARIEEALGDQLVRPTSEQVVYIDLSQPDTVNLYNEEEGASFFSAFLEIFF